MDFFFDLIRMKPETFFSIMEQMAEGTWQALEIFLYTALFSVPLGVLVAVLRESKIRPISAVTRFYQLIMRGTPLMLQLMFFMYGPYYMFGIGMNRFFACILAFVINYAAYFGEIFRAGINSIPQGQYEAGKVLGYTKSQTFFHIVLPQVVKRVLPPTGSEFLVLVKDTALANVIAQPQLFDVAKKTAGSTVSVVPLIVAGIIYLIMSAVVEAAFNHAERKLNYYQ